MPRCGGLCSSLGCSQSFFYVIIVTIYFFIPIVLFPCSPSPNIEKILLSFSRPFLPFQPPFVRSFFVPCSFFLRFWVPLFEGVTKQMRLRSDSGRSEGRNWRRGGNLGKWTEKKRKRNMERTKMCKDIGISIQSYQPIIFYIKHPSNIPTMRRRKYTF